MLPIMKPFINGQYTDSTSEQYFTIHDPSTGKAIAQVPQCTRAEMDAAIAAAKAAFPAWRDTPVRKRASIMMKLRTLLERDLDELTRLVATENGKCWSEAAGDVGKAIEMTELACSAPSLLMGKPLNEALEMGSASAAMLVASHACSRDMPTEDALMTFIAEKKKTCGEVVTAR